MLTMLLVVGYLTTPTNTTGVSLNEYWAWIRYLNATTAHTELRITDDFWQLDSHQKMILSDDFGMGIPMAWLTAKLDFQLVSDGRYFIDRLAALVGASHAKTGKRGPSKSPDFIVRDTSGKWHVVECKGTQSGDKYRDDQLAKAFTQKCTVTFPAALQGQRLACGLSLSNVKSPACSNLKIVDPPGDKNLHFEVQENIVEAAIDTASRSTLAAGLKAAGFFNAGHAIAAPLGPTAATRPTTHGKRHRARTEYVQERRKRIAEELGARTARNVFTIRGEHYVGREVHLNLPRVFQVGSAEIRSVTVQQGIRKDVLEALAGEMLRDEQPELLKTYPTGAKQIALEQAESEATMELGDLFSSRLALES